MNAIFLDGYSLDRNDLDFAPIRAQVDSLDIYPQTQRAELSQRIAPYDVILVNKVKLDRASLENSKSKLICIAATGTDNIDLSACRDFDITVTNCQGYGTDSVAQHALGLMLNLSNQMFEYHQAVVNGRWHESTQFCLLDYPIRELADKTLGIVGYGTLGQRVAELGKAFGMNILVSARPGSTPGNGRVAFDELLQQVDFLSLHCPLTDATYHLIGERELSLMKPTACLINTARGALIDEAALANALEERRIGGAGLDVIDGEPPGANCPFFQQSLPNLIITPHSGWGALEARQRIIQQISENIEKWAQGKPCRVVS